MKEIILNNKGFFTITYLIVPFMLLLSISAKGEAEKFLRKEDSQALKGIAAILIVWHHLSQRVGIGITTLPYIEIGKYSVALFLFLSGYGVMYSFMNNKNY